MKIIDVKLKDLKPYEKNPRKNKDAVDYVANSIRNFGFKVPIVIDKNNVIVCGHTRYFACKKLNIDTVPCVLADDLTDEQIKAYRLADNKVSEFSEWDFNVLSAELEDLVDFDMSVYGFDDTEILGDEYGDEFSLPSGDKSEICQMTFTLHEKQKELIEYAIGVVGCDIKETYGNGNKNGNALYEVVRQWAELRK
ncbi:MAG: ParB N-terminal domain-containing protein [Erysipelotrichia bacterium]|nr:ParB N-terminal domain-containing protein [Erysipelotrichia bacterium]